MCIFRAIDLDYILRLGLAEVRQSEPPLSGGAESLAGLRAPLCSVSSTFRPRMRRLGAQTTRSSVCWVLFSAVPVQSVSEVFRIAQAPDVRREQKPNTVMRPSSEVCRVVLLQCDDPDTKLDQHPVQEERNVCGWCVVLSQSPANRTIRLQPPKSTANQLQLLPP